MSRAWMPLYVADYLADTGHLSPAEHGAYLLLIMHYWQNAGLPTEDRKLARICRMSPDEWIEAKDTISDFFDPNWKHQRIEDELKTANELSEKARGKANKRWQKQQQNENSNAGADAAALQGQCQSQSQSQEGSVAIATGADAPIDPAVAERELFERGKEVLGAKAGGLIANLVRAKGGNIALARAAIETASQCQAPAEYIGGVIRSARQPNRGPPHADPTRSVHDAARALQEFVRGEDDRDQANVYPLLPAIGR